jgi:hypothetical protein
MIPMKDPVNPVTPKFGTASVLQVRILIQWVEQQRRRQLILDTSRAF